MVARHLAATGITIDEADGVESALASLHEHRYDLIVFEMQLPDDDGLALARKIRAFNSNVRLLLMTMFGKRRSDVAAFHAAGVDAFLMKPIRRTQVCDTATRLLRGDMPPIESAPPQEPAKKSSARVL